MKRFLFLALLVSPFVAATPAEAQIFVQPQVSYYQPAPFVVQSAPVVFPQTRVSYYSPVVTAPAPVVTYSSPVVGYSAYSAPYATYSVPYTAYSAPLLAPATVTTQGIVNTRSYYGLGIFRPYGWNTTSTFTPTGVYVYP